MTDVRSSMQYGLVSPTGSSIGMGQRRSRLDVRLDDGNFAEDCPRVNIWTAEPKDDEAPAMVWRRGGAVVAYNARGVQNVATVSALVGVTT